MAEESYNPKKLLSDLTRRCKELTVSDMLMNVEKVRIQNKLGFGHYLFDGRHAPQDPWTIPGALDFDVLHDDKAYEVVFNTAPFSKDEISVHVEEGLLDVEALHVDKDKDSDKERKVRIVKQVPIPIEFDLEAVDAKYEKGKLIIHIPKPEKPRRKVEIA